MNKKSKLFLTDLRSPVQYLKGVGPRRAEALASLEIKTISDLIQYYPRHYHDCSQIKRISDLSCFSSSVWENLPEKKRETIYGTIWEAGKNPSRRKFAPSLYKVIVRDKTGYVSLLFFNQSRFFNYFDKIFKPGIKIIVSGNFKFKQGEVQTSNFDYELIDEEAEKEFIQAGRIVPLYRLSGKMKSLRYLRQLVKSTLDEYLPTLADVIPPEINKKYHLMALNEALYQIHFPSSYHLLNSARRKLVFDEFFFFQLALALRKKNYLLQPKKLKFKITHQFIDRFYQQLPFQLTEAQKRVIKEIKNDLFSAYAMNRLLQGDVGSGKTIVAIFAMLIACESGYQSVLMAPTEILAEQHYLTLHQNLEKLGVRVGLLTSGLKKSQKEKTLEKIKNQQIDIIIGTHALIQKKVKYKNLGLIIIDEQHKFGVLQRYILRKKAEQNIDVLVMTATPIPRTLSLTLYGDLDVSILDEMPKGRQPITTRWVSESKRTQVYQFIRREVNRGHQVYIVYPLVERSEKLDLKAAVLMQKHLQKDIFPDLKVGLLHGQMKVEEKEKIMGEFKENRINILVCTTVIEVGIDIPRATVMLIEHAERFGLASLHQLRGRIGRGAKKSYCLLMTGSTLTTEARERMRAMVSTSDGFKIAELDLAQRGPGEFMGTRQHGLPEFKIAHLIKDFQTLKQARQAAFEWIALDPTLHLPQSAGMKEKIIEEYEVKMQLTGVG